jgi:hypothetical protein
MSLAGFGECDFRKISLEPIKNHLPEQFSDLWITGRVNNRIAEIKALFSGQDTQVGALTYTSDRLCDDGSCVFNSDTIRCYRSNLSELFCLQPPYEFIAVNSATAKCRASSPFGVA